MIFLFWLTYAVISLVCSLFIRNIFVKNSYRSFFFSLVLSFFWAFWFREPGGNELAPIISIILVNTLEGANINFLRLIRPFGLAFITIFLLDILATFIKKRTKNL
tara:strand:- start:884 stop:1198 length:315 start_codon:yes stop_codon:yes gene_type:complete